MRLLIIEDDPSVAGSIELMLKSEAFQVDTTHLGENGVGLGQVNEYELIVLDLNLPDMSGYDVLRSLRVGRIRTPVLILSALADIDHKVRGLGIGADDYLTKPFHKDELLARIRAILRRSVGNSETVIRCGELVVKLDHKRVEMAGRNIELTRKEYEIIELLASRQGAPISKEMFLNHMYGGMDEPEHKIIDVFICKARKKIVQASGGKDYIETVRGRGYTLREPLALGAVS
jgi:two-component system, cell cycle response regulator CtrA